MPGKQTTRTGTGFVIKIAGLLLTAIPVILLSSCQIIEFYGQAICGQFHILNKRRPIEEVMSDPQTSDQLKQKLKLVSSLCDFAKNDLFLPVGHNFRNYIDLERPYVAWSVFAAPGFSLEPRKWCYPIVGCMNYQGYFTEKSAQKYAAKLKTQGLDVYVSGVSAYSTLGWFDDPVLNTFIERSEADLAVLIFHELAHNLLYISGDTPFNEAFATAVASEGVKRWLLLKNDAQALAQNRVKETRRQQFISLVAKYKQALLTVYGQSVPDEVKQNRKQMVFEGLKAEYRQLKQEWGGYKGYDHWFDHDLNNAKLISVATYHDFVPAFLQLLANDHGDLKAFYQACAKIGARPKNERHDLLLDLGQ